MGFYKWHISQQQKDAEFLRDQIAEIRSGAVRAFINKCDYEEHWYGEEFHKSEYQQIVDHALTIFSCMCYMRDCGLMSRKSFGFFKYDYELLFSDSQVVDYLYNLFHNARREHMTFPFEYLVKYGMRENLIKIGRAAFEDPTTYQRNESLHKYLEF